MFKVGLGGRKSPRFLLAAFDALLVVVVVVLVGLVKLVGLVLWFYRVFLVVQLMFWTLAVLVVLR